MHEKAKLRHTLETWSGRELTDEEVNGGFDMVKLLRANAIVQVIHRKSGRGNIYAQITSITRCPKGTAKLEPENELQYFSFEDHTEIPLNIPEWIRDKIMDSYEYHEMTNRLDLKVMKKFPPHNWIYRNTLMRILLFEAEEGNE
jgi:hypothetical protein